MNFDNFPDSQSVSSQDEGSIIDQVIKTRSQATKFFNELNKIQKNHTKKMMLKNIDSNRAKSKQKNVKQPPTLKQMFLNSNKNIKQDFSSTLNKTKSRSKKKVKFNSPPKGDQFKRTSLQKITEYNFCQSIKQMALQLIGTKKNTSDSSNTSQQNQNGYQEFFSGFTSKQFHDGTKFKGICQNGVIIKGQLHFANDFVYNGELFLDKFHGKGTLQLPQKQIIEADWIEGQIIGKATIRYPKGQIYYGDLKNFRRHGEGHLFFNDGSKYQGQFNQGQLTGYGVHITPTGQRTSGYWFYGDYVGTNQQVFQNIMANTAAHEKKRTEKLKKSRKNISKKNVERSQKLFSHFLLDNQSQENQNKMQKK